MKIHIYLLILLLHPFLLKGMSTNIRDTCATNDFCATPIEIPTESDLGFYCITGCTTEATPELVNNTCGIGYSSTVWYKITTDHFGEVMNISVTSHTIQQINISLYYAVNGCDEIEPVAMTSNNLFCVTGYDGAAKAVGTKVNGSSTYFIAITDVEDVGGTFELCTNTLSFGYDCVRDRNIEIKARSSGGPLEGPYLPGERISICFNINSFNAANNECQWLQGVIPVFGNGWDQHSFDANWQPFNATINGKPIGQLGNAMNELAVWEWFTDVDYHWDTPFLQVGDFDGNWNVEMCNLFTDPDCPNLGGIEGSCCAPCWGNPLGTILPGAWFAYGVNGICATPGPPIRVDRGDGINCETMGPWKFCFDLVTRDYPDCMYDKTTNDLTLGFFTTTDAETGSWDGTPVLCNDLPTYWKPGFVCKEINNSGGIETLDDVCSGDVVSYELNVPGIDYWEWTVIPSAHVRDTVFTAENGHVLQSYPVVTGSLPVVIKYNLVGHIYGETETLFKRIQYRAWPQIQFQLPTTVEICDNNHGQVIITPDSIIGGKQPYHYLWSPGSDTLQSLILTAPFQPGTFELQVYDDIGCVSKDSVEVNLKLCDYDEMHPDPAPNDTIHHVPQLPHEGNFSTPVGSPRICTNSHQLNSLAEYRIPNTDHQFQPVQIYPVPSENKVTLKWSFTLQHEAEIEIFSLQGNSHQKIKVKMTDGNQKQLDIQFLPEGIYFVCFSNADFRYVMRMVKI